MTTKVHASYTKDLTLPLMAVRNAYADSVYSSDTGTAVGARSMQTYSFWQADGYSDLEADGAADIDYIGVYVREPDGATIQPEYLDGSVWVEFGEAVTPEKEGPILWLHGEVSALAIRLVVVGGAPKIANFKGGLADLIPVGLPIGYAPGYVNPEDTFTNIMSQRGQILGSNLERTGVAESLTFNDVEDGWVESDFLALRDALRREAVYWAWNAADKPDQLTYVAIDGNAAVSYSQGLYTNISMNLAGPSSGV